ncbi:MAG: GNAT family N-acetyltransferase [Acidimicrobiia bacterium]|nr:GNAT family N-acetyltransferase [Acidimicrobiia bacterium]
MDGGTVRLRDVTTEDLPQFFDDMQDPEALWMAAFTPEKPADRDAFMSHWDRLLGEDSIITRAVIVDGDLAGHVASWVQEGDREITYWISHRFWGRGVATNALRLLVKEIEDRPLFARAAQDNRGSIRVLEKCGFDLVGRERGYANARSAEIDEVVMRLS